MKAIQELYNEVLKNEELKKAFSDKSVQSGKMDGPDGRILCAGGKQW